MINTFLILPIVATSLCLSTSPDLNNNIIVNPNNVPVVQASYDKTLPEDIKQGIIDITEYDFSKDYSSISSNVPNYKKGCRSEVHTYMAYTKVTSKNTPQYRVLNCDRAWSDKKTGLRMFENRYFVAIGQGYGAKAGDYIDIVMSNGNTISAVVGDMKAKKNTDPTKKYHNEDGSVVEMIVDYKYFKDTSQYPEEIQGKVLKIIVTNKNVHY